DAVRAGTGHPPRAQRGGRRRARSGDGCHAALPPPPRSRARGGVMAAYASAFAWARRHVQAERLPSAVVGIATADGIVALDGFGAATDAVYPQFSITKALVGITAARAVERGLLTLETPVTAALPDFGA